MARLHITVVYSPEARLVHEKQLELPLGSSVNDAIQASGLVSQLPQLAELQHQVGVWGKATTANQVLKDMDRVEIYRPLKVDPKVARRERFARQGIKKSGLFANKRAGSKTGY
jgi:putative ubiquitin-RnfH superfamily antitoxin RatB of RatAB toxin-antitoxin module